MNDIENLKGVTIYRRWLFVKNKLYLVTTDRSGNSKFKLALVFYMESDGVDINYLIDKIPIGVVRKAKRLFEVDNVEVDGDVQ